MKFKRIIFPLICLILCSCTGNGSDSIADSLSEVNEFDPEPTLGVNNPYTNPIHPIVNGEKKPTYIADPYVVKDGKDFYLYCTQTEVYTPNREFVRGPVFHSVDMVNWTYHSNVFSSYVPNWGTSGAGVWAPTVVKIGDNWNYYYSFSTGGDANPGIGVATSPTPYGPWDHKGKLFNSEEIGVTNSIDPHVFIDEGKVYMVWGSYGGLITLIELEADGLSPKGGIAHQKDNKVALAGFEVFAMENYEAAFIMKKDGYYYLFLSTGTCCSGAQSSYRVVAGRSENVAGPYLDSQGRDLFRPNRGDNVVVPTRSSAMGVGHCALLADDKGNYWMYYHGYNPGSPYENSRVLYIDLVRWSNITGMPVVNGTYLASNEVPMPGPYLNNLER
jgi:arabinan endo-1,5-alpha-L-arabinosidase